MTTPSLRDEVVTSWVGVERGVVKLVSGLWESENKQQTREYMELEIEQKMGKRINSDKEKKLKNFRITERDFEIFGFLLEQKFASLEQIYFRFFDVRDKVTDPNAFARR